MLGHHIMHPKNNYFLSIFSALFYFYHSKRALKDLKLKIKYEMIKKWKNKCEVVSFLHYFELSN